MKKTKSDSIQVKKKYLERLLIIINVVFIVYASDYIAGAMYAFVYHTATHLDTFTQTAQINIDSTRRYSIILNSALYLILMLIVKRKLEEKLEGYHIQVIAFFIALIVAAIIGGVMGYFNIPPWTTQ